MYAVYWNWGDNMLENIEKINIISVHYGVSVFNKQFVNLPYNMFVFKIDGKSLYNFSNQQMSLSAGQVLFIPQGTNYYTTQAFPEGGHCVLLHFLADIKNPQPVLYNCNSFHDFKYIIDRLIRLSLFDTPANKLEGLSLFYKILSLLHKTAKKSYYDPDKKSLIEPGVEYLENNIFSTELKVEKLHTLCGISGTYFREIFVSVYGETPKKYILKKRLQQAKAILDSGEYIHIYDVAKSVGFDDALYFSKVFKQEYGFSPSNTN